MYEKNYLEISLTPKKKNEEKENLVALTLNQIQQRTNLFFFRFLPNLTKTKIFLLKLSRFLQAIKI